MSDTGPNRFEIDLDEIERQLRRSVEQSASAPAPNADPLAELARIVGQEDPFRGILGETKRPEAGRDRQEPTFTADSRIEGLSATRRDPGLALTDEDRGVLGTARSSAGEPPEETEPFDPVSRSYGGHENAVDSDDFSPLPARTSRRRLGVVMAVLGLTVVGAAGALTWRNVGGKLMSSGPPPLIKADNAPLKVAPENPGGMDIPNQDRQIYERNAETGRSRVLDRQEQPIDVREAARAMPNPDAPGTPGPGLRPQASLSPPPTGATPPRQPVPDSAVSAPPVERSPNVVAVAPAPGRNAVTSALGEPRRVRSVVVRSSDGSAFGPAGSALTTDPTAGIISPEGLPRPISVPTISIPAASNGNGSVPPAPSTPSVTPANEGVATPNTATPVRVLPPQRPRTVVASAPAEVAPAPTGADSGGSSSIADAGRTDINDGVVPADTAPRVRVLPPRRPANAGQQVAATNAATDLPETGASAAPSAAGRSFAVQIAVRPSEEAARTAYDQLSDKFASELGGKPATVTEAQVSGRTVYRVRVTPLSREDANNLCTRLKASGGPCFVTAN